MKVTKNGADIFDISDSHEELKLAADKGYAPVVEVSKDGLNWHNIKGTEDEITLAISKGYKTKPSTTEAPEQYSKKESALRGAGAGFTFGFDDELGGAVGALMGKGYEATRDRIRQQKGEAREQNPWSYGSGEFLGAVALPIGVTGTAAKTVLGAGLAGAGIGAATGAVQAVGDSEKEGFLDNAWEGAKGATLGGVMGGVLGAGTSAISRGMTKAGRQSLGDELEAFRRGAKEDTIFQGTPAAETAARWWNGAKETLKSAGALDEFKKLVAGDKAKFISRMVQEGGDQDGMRAARSMMDQMSDDEYVIRALLDDGDNEVKKWVTKNAAGLQAGQVDSNEYQKILNMGTDARNEARSFAVDKKQIAKELTPDVDNTSTLMKGAVKSRVSELSKEAGEKFDGDIMNLTNDIQLALSDSQTMSTIPSTIKTRLMDAAELLTDGKAPTSFGLSKDFFTDADGPEQFRRLQKMRETLDLGIDWDAIKNGKKVMDEGEQILANLRGKVDEILKATPGKTQADEVYRLGKEIREAVFKKTELKGGVDEFKLKRLFSDTDEGGRFRQSLEELKDWANDPQYAPEAREAASKLVARFESLYKVADNARAINSFRYTQGPSSPAIERLGSTLNKNTIVQDAVRAPASFVTSADQFIKEFGPDVAGKSWKEMSEPEKGAFVKLWAKAKKESENGMPTPEAMKDWYQRFLGATGKK